MGFEFADGADWCVSDLSGSLLVATCKRESGAKMNVTSKIQISGHELKPVARERFQPGVRLGTELAVNDPTQKV